MIDSPKKQRVIVYIDGYNLYYGLRQAFSQKYKWLDLQGLSESLLRPNMELVSVKYFTAITKSTAGVKQRQEVYMKALEAHCDKLEIFYGRFLAKEKRCRQCGHIHASFEEKKTDVQIACQILNDAHNDAFDCCYVISGDSDLVPPLEILKASHPNRHAIVAHPPRRKSTELCKIADGWFAIAEQKIKKNQLPQQVMSESGNPLYKPAEWS